MSGPSRQRFRAPSTPAAAAAGVFLSGLTALILLGSVARTVCSATVPTDQTPPFQTARWTRTLSLPPGSRLDLTNIAGNVTLLGTAGRQLRLAAVKEVAGPAGESARALLEAIRIELTGGDESAEVRVTHPPAAEIRRLTGRQSDAALIGVSFTVELPRDCDVSITTGSGDITARDTGGDVRLETRSGEVLVTDAAGVVEAGSMQGDIRIERAAEVRYVNTVSGGIVLVAIAGSIKATCVSGDIEIRGGTPLSVDASSTGGGIRWEGAVPAESSFALSSHSGAIEFIAAPGAGFTISLSTVSGNIVAPLDLDLQGQNVSRRSVSGTWGVPRAQVTLTTFSGDITLTVRP